MKLTLVRPGPPAMFTGWLAPYRITVRNTARPDRWHVCYDETREKRWRITRHAAHSMKRAKEVAVAWWLKNRVNALFQLASCSRGMAELGTLRQICRDIVGGNDHLAPTVLRDWLEEHNLGRQFHTWIAEPGRKARVAWPKGWEFLGRLQRQRSG